MTSVALYNITGKKAGTFDLPEALFAVALNPDLLHQAYVTQAANRRVGSAHTKVRSDIRGGGRKPWKQKGTGNARTGSIRNPIWRGGGTIFGPLKEKNYKKDLPIKMRRKALAIALSEKARAEKIIVTESLALPDVKTKSFAAFLASVDITPSSAVVGLEEKERETYRAARNIPKVKALEVEKMNVYDIMNAEYVVVSVDGIKRLEDHFITK